MNRGVLRWSSDSYELPLINIIGANSLGIACPLTAVAASVGNESKIVDLIVAYVDDSRSVVLKPSTETSDHYYKVSGKVRI